ncbi:MAG: hypothetical protein KBC94_23135 [Pseudacidovorax sp.]|uniref:hypothetical protein n=1 Tax=Pseudacidovorax sp. TaxID=1934311 RepID=UPI001B7CB097|nr:hypothetical protein [Pseudacidovorax sp.]MBP6897321.1 hypothetical protein [Pseudacidovorax sp.]
MHARIQEEVSDTPPARRRHGHRTCRERSPGRELTPALVKLKRRLERWELDHLRQHAAELAERLEDAERRRSYADQQADFWREQCMRLEEAITDEDSGSGRQIGLTLSGDLVVVEA